MPFLLDWKLWQWMKRWSGWRGADWHVGGMGIVVPVEFQRYIHKWQLPALMKEYIQCYICKLQGCKVFLIFLSCMSIYNCYGLYCNPYCHRYLVKAFTSDSEQLDQSISYVKKYTKLVSGFQFPLELLDIVKCFERRATMQVLYHTMFKMLLIML